MNKFLALAFALLPFCLAGNLKPARFTIAEENDVNYKRHIFVATKSGGTETVDLLSEEITTFAKPEDVSYYVYSRKNPIVPHVIKTTNANSLKETHFDASKRTVVIIHGWTDSNEAKVNVLTRNAVLKKTDVNVIIVDWNPVARKNYITAKNAVKSVGNYVGEFVNHIMSIYGLTGDDFILIGHSLGAHIAGNAGQAIRSKVDHIIGLDPAGPLFSLSNIDNRLDPSDAQFVQVIHTNGKLLGFASSIGDVDHYPNGGMIQAGCGIDLVGVCSHSRSFEFLAEAIEFGEKFIATQCTSYKDFKKNKCTNNVKTNMAEIDIDKSVTGDFFLYTNAQPPFALG